MIIFLILSLILSQIDRTIFSKCQFECGYQITFFQTVVNPFDMLLMYSSIVIKHQTNPSGASNRFIHIHDIYFIDIIFRDCHNIDLRFEYF
jgi:hypothetical protein